MSTNYSQQFQGQVTPIRKKFSFDPPAWKKEQTIGTNGKFFSLLKCWLREPTIKNPSVMLAISLNNGRGSIFSKLNSPDELASLGALFSAWASEVKPLYDTFCIKAQNIEASIELMENMNEGENSDVSPDDFPEVIQQAKALTAALKNNPDALDTVRRAVQMEQPKKSEPVAQQPELVAQLLPEQPPEATKSKSRRSKKVKNA